MDDVEVIRYILDTFVNVLFVPLLLVIAWIIKRIISDGESIARLQSTMSTSEDIRRIIKEYTEDLHADYKDLRTEVKEDIAGVRLAIEQLRKDLGKSRSTD